MLRRLILIERAVRSLHLSHLHADQGEQVLVLCLQVDELGLRPGQLRLELVHLLLELADGSRAAVHRISNPSVRFVHHAAHRIGSLALGQILGMDNLVPVSN